MHGLTLLGPLHTGPRTYNTSFYSSQILSDFLFFLFAIISFILSTRDLQEEVSFFAHDVTIFFFSSYYNLCTGKYQTKQKLVCESTRISLNAIHKLLTSKLSSKFTIHSVSLILVLKGSLFTVKSVMS